MTTNDISLLKAVNAKIDYLDQRQKLIATNIANADTPHYRPMNVKDVDFGRVLQNVTGDRSTVRMATTQKGHMPAAADMIDPKTLKMKNTYEVSPDGNAVILEEQMVNANRTNIDYGLMLNVYRKNVGMLRTAIGAGGQ
ncbi:MAG: flagellar basal body rod protein FlgB [Pseudomonadota bacterium]